MIKNKKGFVVTEVLILSTVIIGVLIFMYSQFKSINRSYQYSFKYDTVEGMYLANNIINYINEDNFDILVEQLNNSADNYIDITDCSVYLFNTSSFCETLLEKSEVEKIIFTEENLTKIKSDSNDLNNDMKDYINQIKTYDTENDYRIIVKYLDGTFASMRFNKGNSYVTRGLIAYLDGINNTGNGHSSDTNTWVDLSGHGNDAILYNNPTWSNNSIIFDGQTNYGRLENTSGITYDNGTTWEMRIKVISYVGTNNSGHICIFGNWETAGGGLYLFNNQKFNSYLYIDSGWKTVQDTDTSSLNEYYTITITYDNSKIKLYVNGNLKKEKSIEANPVISSTMVPLSLGGNPNISNTSMDSYGNVEFENVLIYDRALTESEVLRNYQADISRY